MADVIGYAPVRTFSPLTVRQIRAPRRARETNAARWTRLCRTFDLTEIEAALLISADARPIDAHGRISDDSSWNR